MLLGLYPQVVALSYVGDSVRALFLDLDSKQLKLGSGHTIKGLMAALGTQCPGSEVVRGVGQMAHHLPTSDSVSPSVKSSFLD